jgi:PadR family transcriptional regulator PadR
MENINSDLIRGNIDTIILKTMLNGDMYGLDIIKEVENKSNGTYNLKQPTLYSCLKRLENQDAFYVMTTSY